MDTLITKPTTETFLAAVAYGGSSVHAIRDQPAERARMGMGTTLITGPALCGIRGSAGGLTWGFHLQGAEDNPDTFPPAVPGRPPVCPRCARLATEVQR
jgi:hypothetical protein